MNKEQLKALKEVVHYLFNDEKKNWEELDRPDNHIFERVLELNVFLQSQEYCKICGDNLYGLVRVHHHTEPCAKHKTYQWSCKNCKQA